MPMFDDPRKALNRLQQELLEEEAEYGEEYLSEEDWLDDEIAQAKALLGMAEDEDEPEVYRNYANGYGYLNAEEEDEEIVVDDTKGQRILTFLLVLGILAVVCYWMVVLL